MNHYPHHIGDFNNATRHLTRVERALYRDMLELYYDTEQPLNSDVSKIARRVLASSEEEKHALNMVLEEFFVLMDDGWHNSRCDAEIAKYQGQIEQASRAGKASAAKRFNKRSTTVEQPFNQPEPEPEPKKKSASPRASLLAIPPTLLADYLAVRKAKRAGPLTKTAAAILEREAEKAGISVADAVTACCEYGWQGFNAGWYAERNAGRNSQPEAVFAGAI